MRPGSLALLGVAAYSAILVATMPARWVAERVLPPGPRSIAMQEIEGTVWKGSARAAFGSHAGTFVLDRIEWSFLPSRLLQGRAAYAMAVRGAGLDSMTAASCPALMIFPWLRARRTLIGFVRHPCPTPRSRCPEALRPLAG